jgi:hypothetical protein
MAMGLAAAAAACGGDGSDSGGPGGAGGIGGTAGSGASGGTSGFGATAGTAATAGSGASAGAAATAGAGGGAGTIASCQAAGCPSYDCDCQDGSARRFRSCSAADESAACQQACEGLGGVGHPVPGTPQQSSPGVHIGDSCTQDFDCDSYALMCAGWSSQINGAKCVASKCADYAGTVGAVCANGPEAPAPNASGTRFLRGCGGIESLHFYSDETQPTEARIYGVIPTPQGFRAVGRFRGRIRLGSEDEACLGGGLFVAQFDHESRMLDKQVLCRDDFVPVVAEDGIYGYIFGKATLAGGALTITKSAEFRSLVRYDWSLAPQWAREISVPAGKGLYLFAAKTGVYLRAQVPLTLWDSTAVDLQTLVRVDAAGQVAYSVATTANLSSFDTNAQYLAITASSDSGSFEVNGQTYTAPEPKKSFTLVLDDQGAVKYVAAASALKVGADGSGAQARFGESGGDRILERFDSAGKLVWSKTVLQVKTPHLYYAGGLSSPYVLPDGRMVGILALSADETTTFAGKQLSGEQFGMYYVVQFGADGTPHYAERIRPCNKLSFHAAVVTSVSDLVLVGSAQDCDIAGTLGDVNWPLKSSYVGATSGLMLRYGPLL